MSHRGGETDKTDMNYQREREREGGGGWEKKVRVGETDQTDRQRGSEREEQRQSDGKTEGRKKGMQ